MFVWRDFWEHEKLRKKKWRDNYFKMDVWLGRGGGEIVGLWFLFSIFLFYFFVSFFCFCVCSSFFDLCYLKKKKKMKCPYPIFLNKKCVTFLFYLMGDIIVNLYQLHFPSSHFFFLTKQISFSSFYFSILPTKYKKKLNLFYPPTFLSLFHFLSSHFFTLLTKWNLKV